MTKTDLLKDITAKFDSFDEKHLLLLNLNKNLNLYLKKNKSYLTLCMLLYTTDECLRERYRVQTYIYTLCLHGNTFFIFSEFGDPMFSPYIHRV